MSGNEAVPPDEVQRSLRVSVFEGALWAVMVGVSESYLGALAVELGHADLALALLVTAPLLCGAVAQVTSPKLVQLLGSRRRVCMTGALVQALVHLGFFAIAWFEIRSFTALLVAKILYWVTGMTIGPAWNAWMGGLTRGVNRGRYFSSRSAVVQIALLAAFAAAGFILDDARHDGRLLETFAMLHLVALGARLASTAALRAQADPYAHEERSDGPLFARVQSAARTSKWRVALFVVVFYFGANIGVPFFTPYMLRVLQFDFVDFMAVSAFSVAAKALTFPLWGRLAERIGLRAVLFLSTLGVSVIAILWASFTDVPTIMAIQALSGVSWAGFEFASFQLLLKSARPQDRVAFFAVSTSLTGVAQVTGSLVGTWLLTAVPLGYEVAFVASGFGRALPLFLLLSPMVAGLSRGELPRVFFRVISVRPDGGSVRTPIVTREPSQAGRPSPPPAA